MTSLEQRAMYFRQAEALKLAKTTVMTRSDGTKLLKDPVIQGWEALIMTVWPSDRMLELSIEAVEESQRFEEAKAAEKAKLIKEREPSTHCRNGHERTPETVQFRRGHMRCRVCDKESEQRRNKEKKKAAAARYYAKNRERVLAQVTASKQRALEKDRARREALTEEQWQWAKQYKCPQGCERTRENTGINTRGARFCYECITRNRSLGAKTKGMKNGHTP
jgi:hypothetical protein